MLVADVEKIKVEERLEIVALETNKLIHTSSINELYDKEGMEYCIDNVTSHFNINSATMIKQ